MTVAPVTTSAEPVVKLLEKLPPAMLTVPALTVSAVPPVEAMAAPVVNTKFTPVPTATASLYALVPL